MAHLGSFSFAVGGDDEPVASLKLLWSTSARILARSYGATKRVVVQNYMWPR